MTTRRARPEGRARDRARAGTAGSGRDAGRAGEPPGGDLLVAMYRAMVRLRRIDERMLRLQRQGRIGFYGPATGQEGAVIGCAAALRRDDWVFPALREGGIALWRGYPLRALFCQNFGNRDDLLRGRQMPCHYADRSVGFVSWSSCIATQLPHAVGAAHAMRLRGADTIALACLGDGATSEGDFHVAMNFAGVLRAPVVFFCQNNQWAISVPVTRQTASESIAVKAEAYGFPGVRVDGNDAVAVYRAVYGAAEAARQGGGPTLVEALTYRLGAHSSSDDPARYRDERVTERWRTRRDPLQRLASLLRKGSLWDDRREEALQGEIDGEIRRTLAEVEPIGPPERASMFEDVYGSLPPHLRAQQGLFLSEDRGVRRSARERGGRGMEGGLR